MKHLGVSFSCCASRQRVTAPFSRHRPTFLSLSGVFCHAVCSVQSVFSNPLTNGSHGLKGGLCVIAQLWRALFSRHSVLWASYRGLHLDLLGCFDDENQNHATNNENYSDGSAQRARKHCTFSIF